jgi:hypothetical protein
MAGKTHWRLAMLKSKKVCVVCQKIDGGDGIWTKPTDEYQVPLRNSLCPECCYQRFPQFYSDYQPPISRLKRIPRVLSSIFR